MKRPPQRTVTVADHAALGQVGTAHRSDVRRQGLGQRFGIARIERSAEEMVAHEQGRNLKDVGDQALMRGLATAFPRMRPGAVPILRRASAGSPATKRLSGVPLPRFRPHPCAMARRLRRVSGHAGRTSWATDHMKPTSSRAMAVHTTVVRLPRAARARYRAVSRACAFQAISRTFGGRFCRR
jgi:hypothetical protein